MSTEYDITANALLAQNARPVHAGDDYNLGVTINRGGVALSLEDATVWLTIKESSIKSDAAAKLQLCSSDPDQIEITDEDKGELVIKFRSAATADLEGLWLYDLQVSIMIDDAPMIITVARGKFEFLSDITRTTIVPTPPPSPP